MYAWISVIEPDDPELLVAGEMLSRALTNADHFSQARHTSAAAAALTDFSGAQSPGYLVTC
jgi:hypothetical protein